MVGDRREQVSKAARLRGIIELRHVEYKTVRENAARVSKGECAVTQGVIVDFQAGKPIGIPPQTRGDKVECVFEITVLELKVMRPQIHSL